ncbi:MAG: hypothetical protein JST93_33530 [Acidobacteria bacterium]|nr:hypothetical protein [Acidobacteriota bacterium]
MLQVDALAAKAVEIELSPGETVLWAGRPEPGIHFRKEDFFLIPFSLLWGGGVVFMIFMSLGVSRKVAAEEPPPFMLIVLSVFFVMGQYFIWGRFVYASWKKKRTFYALTNRRVIAVQHGTRHQTASAFLDSLPALELLKGRGDVGSLRFKESVPFNQMGMMAWDSMAMGASPSFIAVAHARELYQFILQAREQARTNQPQRIS